MIAARTLGLPTLADAEDSVSAWPFANAARLAGMSPPYSTTTQMENTKPSGFVHNLITSASATLAVFDYPYQEEMLSLAKPEKSI